ncbi:MAG: hypothetical protein ORN49_03875, partial [Rhodobacteraceae bacterium]|nr:hypothetical protein [Paracoccaceae bacterium]
LHYHQVDVFKVQKTLEKADAASDQAAERAAILDGCDKWRRRLPQTDPCLPFATLAQGLKSFIQRHAN